MAPSHCKTECRTVGLTVGPNVGLTHCGTSTNVAWFKRLRSMSNSVGHPNSQINDQNSFPISTARASGKDFTWLVAWFQLISIGFGTAAYWRWKFLVDSLDATSLDFIIMKLISFFQIRRKSSDVLRMASVSFHLNHKFSIHLLTAKLSPLLLSNRSQWEPNGCPD